MFDTGEVGFESGERVLLSDGDDLIARCAARTGITYKQAEDAMAFFDEHYSSNDTMVAGSLSKALAERDASWWNTLRSVLHAAVNYQQNQKTSDSRFLRMVLPCVGLALGMSGVAGAEYPAELARRLGLARVSGGSGKQTVTKCVEHFRKVLRLAKIPGQRDEAAREEMRRARLEALQRNGGLNETKP